VVGEGRDELFAGKLVPSSVVHLHPEDAVTEGMLRGWAAQGRSRGLASGSVATRERLIQRFIEFSGEYPWRWSPEDVEAWSAHLRDGGLTLSTLRGYQAAVRQFCDYVTDSRYGWGAMCWERFGTHPVQVCHEWNSVVHVSEIEARPAVRPLTRQEIQLLFDFADDRVEAAQRSGRKGWLSAWRDAAMFKVAYGFGLRRRELARLELADFHSNPKAAEFGRFGVCNVRWGKAVRGGHPRRRSVLAVMPWTSGVLEEYLEVRQEYADRAGTWLWPTERGAGVSTDYVSRRFAEYRDALGLPSELHPHCLRHSYVTHLLEDGFDPYFVQQQVGHRWGGSTGLYSGVSSDFKNRSLRSALDRLTKTSEEGTDHDARG